MCKSLFITATSTDIGKTYISALIVKKLRELGNNCGYYKPVLSGLSDCSINDAQYVIDNAKLDKTSSDIISYGFNDAVSPHLASMKQNVFISVDKIKTDYSKLKSNYEYLVVEGAGGITCPLDLSNGKRLLMSDLISSLGLDVLIVADAGLGTINSTLLTVEYAKYKGICVRGIILNNYDKSNYLHQDNLSQIEYLAGIKVVATVEKDASCIAIDDRVLKGLFT